ncbi:hypothetical protein [Gluconobacter kondonii]|uniref:hypothetical protein n=1 Tax=Gluconobacter kondonii TaxID=941463 RepID=UPI001B8D66EA|nr:hypothetical protein [Gluconobacter kondonii]MBS1053478.1 hypothetical protein [Gluconobacter kondonii]
MTNPAWPPEKGFPAKPEEEGWPWLQHRTNDTPAPYHWREEDCTGEWRWGGGMHETIIKKEVVTVVPYKGRQKKWSFD